MSQQGLVHKHGLLNRPALQAAYGACGVLLVSVAVAVLARVLRRLRRRRRSERAARLQKLRSAPVGEAVAVSTCTLDDARH